MSCKKLGNIAQLISMSVSHNTLGIVYNPNTYVCNPNIPVSAWRDERSISASAGGLVISVKLMEEDKGVGRSQVVSCFPLLKYAAWFPFGALGAIF